METASILSRGIYAAPSKKINKRIEIVSSTVVGLSSMGVVSRRSVYNVLAKHYSKVGITLVNTISDLEALVASRPDLVFLGMKFVGLDPDNPRGQGRIWLSSYLEEHGIVHTGSGQAAHQLELNKSLAKQSMLDAGLRTARFYVSKQNQPSSISPALIYPLFVKPADRGGGQGIDGDSLVCNPAELQLKIDSLANNLQADALVEEYLPGREFSVAILKNEFSGRHAVMPIEITAPADMQGHSFLSAAVKCADIEKITAVHDNDLKEALNSLAFSAFRAIGGRDYGRIDIRLNASGEPNFLEANLLPSLISGYGSFPRACQLNEMLDHEAMVLAIVALGLKRDCQPARTNVLEADQDEILGVELAGTISTA